MSSDVPPMPSCAPIRRSSPSPMPARSSAPRTTGWSCASMPRPAPAPQAGRVSVASPPGSRPVRWAWTSAMSSPRWPRARLRTSATRSTAPAARPRTRSSATSQRASSALAYFAEQIPLPGAAHQAAQESGRRARGDHGNAWNERRRRSRHRSCERMSSDEFSNWSSE